MKQDCVAGICGCFSVGDMGAWTVAASVGGGGEEQRNCERSGAAGVGGRVLTYVGRGGEQKELRL